MTFAAVWAGCSLTKSLTSDSNVNANPISPATVTNVSTTAVKGAAAATDEPKVFEIKDNAPTSAATESAKVKLEDRAFGITIQDLKVSRDGRLVALAFNRQVTVYDSKSLTKVGEWKGGPIVHSVTFLANGTLAIGTGEDHGIVLWDLKSKRETKIPLPDRAQAYALAAAPEAKGSALLVSAYGDNAWLADSRQARIVAPVGRADTLWHVRSAEFLPGGQEYVVISENGAAMGNVKNGLEHGWRADEVAQGLSQVEFRRGDLDDKGQKMAIAAWIPALRGGGLVMYDISKDKAHAIYSFPQPADDAGFDKSGTRVVVVGENMQRGLVIDHVKSDLVAALPKKSLNRSAFVGNDMVVTVGGVEKFVAEISLWKLPAK